SFFFQAEDGIRDFHVTGVQTCALPISTHTSACVPAMNSMARSMGYGTRGTWGKPPPRVVRRLELCPASRQFNVWQMAAANLTPSAHSALSPISSMPLSATGCGACRAFDIRELSGGGAAVACRRPSALGSPVVLQQASTAICRLAVPAGRALVAASASSVRWDVAAAGLARHTQ